MLRDDSIVNKDINILRGTNDLQVHYRLSSIQEEYLTLHVLDKALPEDREATFGVGLNVKWIEDRYLSLLLDIQAFYPEKDDMPNLPVYSFGIKVTYELINAKEFSSSKGGVELPEAFFTQVTGVSIGIARGIVHARTTGYPHNLVLLPIINPTALFRQVFAQAG